MSIPSHPVKFSSFYRVAATPDRIRRNGPEPQIDGAYQEGGTTYFWCPEKMDEVVKSQKLKGLSFDVKSTEEALAMTNGEVSKADLQTLEGRQRLTEIAGYNWLLQALAEQTSLSCEEES